MVSLPNAIWELSKQIPLEAELSLFQKRGMRNFSLFSPLENGIHSWIAVIYAYNFQNVIRKFFKKTASTDYGFNADKFNAGSQWNIYQERLRTNCYERSKQIDFFPLFARKFFEKKLNLKNFNEFMKATIRISKCENVMLLAMIEGGIIAIKWQKTAARNEMKWKQLNPICLSWNEKNIEINSIN